MTIHLDVLPPLSITIVPRHKSPAFLGVVMPPFRLAIHRPKPLLHLPSDAQLLGKDDGRGGTAGYDQPEEERRGEGCRIIRR